MLRPKTQKSKLYYDRRSAGQSVLEQSTLLGLTTRSWLLSDSCWFVGLGRPLWREDESAVCSCCWPLLAQSFSGPSPFGPAAIFCCLKFETTLFVASYDSQGHGGGIRSLLHTGRPKTLSFITSGEPNIDHHFQQFTLSGAYPLLQEP
jgi:hypothetical protein